MRKWNSVLANLAVSYVTIVLVIVLLICSFFYIYISTNYKEELREGNQLILENTVQTIEATVLQRVQQIYLELSLDKSADIRLFADSSFQHNPSQLLDLQELLKAEVTSNSDIVHAVHLYDPGHNVMLSSIHGLTFQADEGKSAEFFADWIDGMRSSKQNSLWTPTRLVPQDVYSSMQISDGHALMTYARSFPFQSSGENADLMIAIDVKESALSGIIRNMMPMQYKSTFIIDSVGEAITVSDHSGASERQRYESSRTQVLASNQAAGSFSDSFGDISHVVSYQTLPSTGWKLYSATPASRFYEKSIFVQKLVIGICLLAIFVGLVLSGIFAKVSYSPIKRLVGKIKVLLDHPPDHVTNEYKLIDTAFIRLNDKVSSLEDTLQANSSVIKHNVVLNMLNNSYTREQLADEIQFLNISEDFGHYCCMVVNAGAAMTRLNSRNTEYVVYRIINQLENAALSEGRLIAEELPDKRIVIIFCSRNASDELLDQVSCFVVEEGKQQFQLNFQISWGSWVQEACDIHMSFNEAQTLMKYTYFLPDISILKDRSLLARENSVDEIPQSVLARFKEKLHIRQSHEIVNAIEQLVMTMREGMYSAEYCHFILSNTVFVYTDYLKSIRFQYPEQGNLDLYHQYTQLRNIEEFREWLVDSVSTFVAQMEKRNSERSISSIESAKQYILAHLSEDLSLEAVASKVYISPKYLSKLFKEETGVTYTEFVTSQRMERAKTLIESSNMTVEQIASTVGYGTAAYFIKKFKELHGCTPRNYMLNIAKQV